VVRSDRHRPNRQLPLDDGGSCPNLLISG
jgi:hypothetical protein